MLSSAITYLSAILAMVGCSPTSRSSVVTAGIKPHTTKNTRTARSFEVPRFDFVMNFDQWDHFLKYDLPLAYDLNVGHHQFGNPEYYSSLGYNTHYTHSFAEPSHSSPEDTSYIYKKQLFFEDVPHVKLLLENQQLRKSNNLPLNLLGSIRPGSPFERYLFKK